MHVDSHKRVKKSIILSSVPSVDVKQLKLMPGQQSKSQKNKEFKK